MVGLALDVQMLLVPYVAALLLLLLPVGCGFLSSSVCFVGFSRIVCFLFVATSTCCYDLIRSHWMRIGFVL